MPREFRHDSHPWLANLTMLQTVLGRPQLQGQYWSLLFELTFYGLCGLLLALGVFRRSVEIAVLALGTALGLHVLARLVGHTAPLGLGNVATMFVGGVLYRVHSGADPGPDRLAGLRRRAGRHPGRPGHPAGRGTPTAAPAWRSPCSRWRSPGAVPTSSSELAFHFRDRLSVPRWLIFVGEVSYSVYLLHPLAFAVLGRDFRGCPAANPQLGAAERRLRLAVLAAGRAAVELRWAAGLVTRTG